MLNAIGNLPAAGVSAASAAGVSTASAAALTSQLSRYQKQLADCVNCAATAKTPEGQQTARDLSDKISAIKTRIEAVTNTKSSVLNAADDERTRNTSNPTATLGNHLDIFA